MSEVTTTAVAPAPSDLGGSTPGEYLRKLREEKGLTHAAVGTALHLTVHYIKALEGDEYGKLPGLTFVKGYLRAYARFLGADVDNVLARFDEHIAGLLDAGQHTARVERSKRRQDQALRWAIGAGCVVVIGLVAGWWFMRDTQPPAPTIAAQRTEAEPQTQQTLASQGAIAATTTVPPAAAAAGIVTQPDPFTAGAQPATIAVTPVQNATMLAQGASIAEANAPTTTTAANAIPALTPPATAAPDAATAAMPVVPAPAADAGLTEASPADNNTATITPGANGAREVSLIGAGNDELRVTFNGNSWIEVDDGSMVRLYNDMLNAGDTLTIRGQAPFHVLLGDASQVQVSLNAMVVDISADIRADSTARLVLGAPVAAPAADQTSEEVPL